MLYINGSEIERVDSFKYLGFQLDSKLNHNLHVEKLCSKLSLYCHITRKIKDHLTVDASRNIYYALIHSIVSYGLLVWGRRLLNGPVAEKLHKLQNKIVLNLFGSTTETINDVGYF